MLLVPFFDDRFIKSLRLLLLLLVIKKKRKRDCLLRLQNYCVAVLQSIELYGATVVSASAWQQAGGSHRPNWRRCLRACLWVYACACVPACVRAFVCVCVCAVTLWKFTDYSANLLSHKFINQLQLQRTINYFVFKCEKR